VIVDPWREDTLFAQDVPHLTHRASDGHELGSEPNLGATRSDLLAAVERGSTW
jgi:hypothetical protein